MGPQTPPKNSHLREHVRVRGQKPVIVTLAIIYVKFVEIFRIANIFEIINFVRIISCYLMNGIIGGVSHGSGIDDLQGRNSSR